MFSLETPTPVMTANRVARETPLFLVCGAETYLPPETFMGSPWAQSF
jgi:hypothetical protein